MVKEEKNIVNSAILSELSKKNLLEALKTKTGESNRKLRGEIIGELRQRLELEG